MSPCQLHGLSNADSRGRGRVYMGHDGNEFSCLAHRLAWALHNGEDPAGRVVRHKCDNPACVNPEHLEIGTQADNVRDRVERGRSATDNRNGMSKKYKRGSV